MATILTNFRPVNLALSQNVAGFKWLNRTNGLRPFRNVDKSVWDNTSRARDYEGDREGIPHIHLACEQALLFGQAKRASQERASEGPRKGELATIFHKFSFPPRKSRDSERVKTVTANVPQIRKVTTACKVSLDSRGRVELFIYKSLSQQHQSNVINHLYVFFHGDIELQRVSSEKNSLL